jgi:hypothetical protein
MTITPMMENFIDQVRQNPHIISADYSEVTPIHLSQIDRTDLVVLNLVIDLDSVEDVPVDFIIAMESFSQDSYGYFASGLDDLMKCDCVVANETHNDRIMRDINQSAFDNNGRTAYFIRPADGWMVPIRSANATVIVPTDPVFLELIDKLKNVEYVLDVTVEELLDYSILKEEEKEIKHVFFRVKHTIPGTTDTGYAHFMLSEPSCCNVLEHQSAVTQLTNLISAYIV